jgi:hypothetical protein
MAVALSAVCVLGLAAYLAAFATGAAADGLGWLFALPVYTVLIAYYGAPVVAVVSGALAVSSPARATRPRLVTVALVLAAAALALWFVAKVLHYVPRSTM